MKAALLATGAPHMGGGNAVTEQLRNILGIDNIRTRYITGPRKNPVQLHINIRRAMQQSTQWAAGLQCDLVLGASNHIPPDTVPGMRRAAYIHTSWWTGAFDVWGPHRDAWRHLRLPALRLDQRIMYRWHRRHIERNAPGATLLCNAQWVRDAWVERGRTHRVDADLHVVHPPCRMDYHTLPVLCDMPRRGVISVGRLVPYKGHDFCSHVCVKAGAQLDVYGAGQSTYRPSMHDPHHEIHVSRPTAELDNAACLAQCVMSGCHVEDFGVAVVEAAARGAIPVVPDRWGFKETVPWPELRYEPWDALSAIQVLAKVMAGEYDTLRPAIIRHMQQYNVATFNTKVLQHLA